MKKRIVLLGPPASGKGTQAEMISATYHLPVTSPGSILREEKRAGTQLGLEADALTSQGRLLPDEVINGVVKSWLDRHDSEFVFDGYPRSAGQAAALDEMLSARNTSIEVVLSLEADLETIRDRVSRRLMCSQCGCIVSLGLHVQSAGAPCPSCGGALVKRGDDSPEALEARMEEYREKTEPLISYYQKRGLLHAVNANRKPEVVFAEISGILENP